MRLSSIQTRVWPIGLTLAVLLGAGGNARAQSYTWSDLTNAVSNGANDNEVSLTYTNAQHTSQTTTSSAVATGFSVTQGASTFGAFCIDLWHTQSASPVSATNYTLNSNGTLGNTSTLITALFVNAPNSAAVTANELTYLGTVYQAIQNAGDSNSIGALALAIWSVIDKNFSVSGESTGMGNDLALIKDLLAGTSETIDDHLITGYNSNDTYTGATVLETNTSPTKSSRDQNLITWGTITISGGGNESGQSLAPEPSTLAIAGLGALAFIGYGLRRRKAPGA